MGRGEVLLKELIEREVAAADWPGKTPLIERRAMILPVGASNPKPMGTVKYKMRLRKPIREQFRVHQDRIDIDNMTRQNEMAMGTVHASGATKKLVTIQVLQATGLKVRYAEMNEVAPFYYF